MTTVRAQAQQLGQQRTPAIAQAAQLAANADAEQAGAARAAAAGDDAAFQQASANARTMHQNRRQLLGSLSDVDQSLAALVAALPGDSCDLEPDVPVALLPVRLETRYSADKSVLQVRIYADDIHVDRLDRGLSDDERAAGVGYWTSVWDGSAAEELAWQRLVAAVHPSRAEYVAGVLTPDLTQSPGRPARGRAGVPVDRATAMQYSRPLPGACPIGLLSWRNRATR